MQGASHFIFDGISSETYNLQIVEIDAATVKEVTALSATLRTRKPSRINRHFHEGVTYDRMPEHQFTVLCDTPGGITDSDRRAILRWLVGRNAFKTLILVGDADKYTYHELTECYPAYNAVFTNAETIYIQNRCYGFKFTVAFDSPYAMLYKKVTDADSGAVSYAMVDMWEDGSHIIEKTDGAGLEHTIKWTNDSDIKYGFVYPIIYLNRNGLTIINTSDGDRKFEILNCGDTSQIKINCQTKTISATRGSASIGNISEDGRQWLRLKHGVNELKTKKADTSVEFDFQAPVYVAHGL